MAPEKNRTLYRTFFALYIPLVLQQMITLGVNLADNIMLGAYGESALAGVAAVNQIQFIFQNILMGTGDGLVMFCSQYWGEKKTEPMRRISATAMHFALIVAVILFAAATFAPSGVMHIFTDSEPIVREGLIYLNIIRFTYPFFAVTQILLASMRSVGRVRIAFALSVMTLIVNCCINYTLIFGHFGAPALGTAGAAIGTLVARILEVAVLIWYVKFKDTDLRLKLAGFFRHDPVLSRDYFRVSWMTILVQGLWGVNTALQTVILGHMNSIAIAANSAASNMYLLVKASAIGAASSASVIIGREVGEGDYVRVQRTAVSLQKLFVILGIAGGLVLFVIYRPILGLYDLAPETRAMAASFLQVLCVIQVFQTYQMPTNSGIIRGGGNARFQIILDLISIWCIVLPLSAIMAFVVKASPVAVIWCLNADQIFKGVPIWYYVNRKNWIRKLTR